MLSKSSKWELDFVHYITKFTILKFVISRFECILVKIKRTRNRQKVRGAEQRMPES